MRAMVLENIGAIENNPLRLQELPDPQPAENEVRVRVSCCAICRTDLHVIEGELPRQRLPLIPGHQIVGVVDRIGAKCKRLKVGLRVGIAWLRHTCGACAYCDAGRENLCTTSRFTGYHEHGGYAEYAVVPEDFAYELPAAEQFDDVQVAPLLCAGIIGYRALRRCNLRDGGSVALYGFGASAHVVAQLAVARGCRVFAVSRTPGHRELALRLGACWAGENAAALPEDVESAIIFAPAGELVPPALERLRPGGTLALAGIYMSAIPELDYERHVFYERDIHSVTSNTREDGRELLTEAAASQVHTNVKTYALEQANVALQDLKAGRIDGAGVLLIQD